MSAVVIPFPRGHVPVAEIISEPALVKRPKPICPVCGLAGTDWTCKSCDTEMHEPCYWGRVATLDEWRDYLARWIEPEEWNQDVIPVVCPACRARQGQAS